MRLKVVYTEALESPRFFQRKALNSTQDKGSLTAWFQRLCKYQQKLILLQRNEAVNGVRLVPVATAVAKWFLHFSMACGFKTTSLSLEEQVYAEYCHRRRASLLGTSELI